MRQTPPDSRAIRATYRIQMHPGFDFDAAARIVPYLANLGVTHVYCSPYLQAAPGSMHGYDVVDHGSVNAELGGEKAHEWFCRVLSKHGLGQVVDVVPNHMAISGAENRWWWDVLENGPSSRYASYFDVDWSYSEEEENNRILLPILGDRYGRAVDGRQIRLERRAGSFLVRYFDHVFPIDPRSIAPVLLRSARRSDSDELGFLADALEALPAATTTNRAEARRRHRDKEVIRARLGRLLDEAPTIRHAVDEDVESVNSSPELMDALLVRQNYRLAFWRVARSDLAYRRFFDINDLVGLRVEDDDAFVDSHALVLDWVARGLVDGLRIDHPDGLLDPEGYFRRLRDAAPDTWIVAEKILHPGESLQETWPIDGTTGYDFMALCGALMVDPRGASPLTDYYHQFIGADAGVDYPALLQEQKDRVVSDLLGSDLNRLAALATEICSRDREYRDYTRDEVYDALAALVASFPVYRSYVRAGQESVDEVDRAVIDAAVRAASERRGDIDPHLFALFGSIMRLERRDDSAVELATRIQQVTGPVMAKGAEDTAFYRYSRFTALNEVGGDPSVFGCSLERFHAAQHQRAEKLPSSMLATSTHDTKRSEDVRMRLSVLAEMPEAWIGFCETMREFSAALRTGDLPDPETEYLIYQTLIGAWPIDEARIVGYVEKAVREAKVHTSWTEPNSDYERAIADFARAVIAHPDTRATIDQMVASIDPAGTINALSLVLLKLTSPGIPDIYQGNEVFDFSLVDPDNRRAVDYDARSALLDDLETMSAADTLNRTDGAAKLLVTSRALAVRARRAGAFGRDSGYTPVYAHGTRSDHVVSFIRSGGSAAVLTIAVRFPWSLAGDWDDTTVEIPDGGWTDVFTGVRVDGGAHRVARLLAGFPVALLEMDHE
ncbi:MAG: malto-oligosyltrehalose synthase [Spirochaetaceae bacterium]|nr:MAG: malto-oligosyltrehalose synthase [Spirochaetaceae bacterium]